MTFSSSPVPYLFLLVFVGLAINFLFFSDKAKFRRRLKKAPLKKLDDLRDGEVARFTGKVELLDEPLIAPFSHRPCALFTTEVTHHRSTGKSSSTDTLIKEQKASRFLIRSAGGAVALIDNYKLRTLVVEDVRLASGFMDDPTPRMENYLNAHGIKSETMMGFNKSLQYREGVLEPGETVTVLGQGHWSTPQVLDLNLPDEKILVVTPAAQEPIYISDDPEMVRLPATIQKEKKAQRSVKKAENRRKESRQGRYLK